MANVRDSDTSLWLHNKLGSNEPWTSGSVCSQFNPEVLRNIKECFIELQTQVKLKLLLSFFHINRRNLDEWRIELEEILEVALADSEQWVSMLAEVMKPYAASACLNLEVNEPEENKKIFYDLINEVNVEIMRSKTRKKRSQLLPMECHYLNKMALSTLVADTKAQEKDFILTKKPKCAALRVELMLKANDAAKSNSKKIPAPTIPLRTRGMPRKMTDTTPLKGIPSQTPPARPNATTPSATNPRPVSRTPAGKKEGGVKLLEITEQPMGFVRNKRLKKTQGEKENDLEEPKKQIIIEGNIAVGGFEDTPDYAAGLSASGQPPSPTPPDTPTAAPQTPTSFQQSGTQSGATTPIHTASYARTNSIPDGPPPTPTPITNTTDQSSPTVSNYIPLTTQNPVNRKVQTVPTVQTMTKTVILQVPTHTPQQIVTLSKDLMEKAQEIFKTANKATRPEKEHILKFMAGTRENPCPELGSIVTIKLSEHEENIRQKDGAVLPLSVETHFQMNYNTGEWKVIQKPPKVENPIVAVPIIAASKSY